MQALAQLQREHGLILRMLNHAEACLEPFDGVQVARAMTFFVCYVGEYHHAKEDQVLFPALLERARDILHGAVGAMRKEHAIAEGFLGKAQEFLPPAARGDKRAQDILRRFLTMFIELERAHIQKEEVALYSLAAQLLPPSVEASLLERFEAVAPLSSEERALYEQLAQNPRRHTMVVPGRPGPGAVPIEFGEQPLPLDPRTLARPEGAEAFVPPTLVIRRPERALFEEGAHRALRLSDFGEGKAVQANQFLIIDHGEGMLLDPGGPKIYPKLLSETLVQLDEGTLRYIFLSHQDPDICTSINAWLLDTDAVALTSRLWMRFLPHFGLDELLEQRLHPIPDEGQRLKLGRAELWILPGHFLHSCGNFQVYDPVSKILFSGDLGASFGAPYTRLERPEDLEDHLRYMTHFHQRYIPSGEVLRIWARMVRGLDVQTIAPQHGAILSGPALVERFLQWCERLRCGIELMAPLYKPPA